MALGSDGIAISADGACLYYCALASRRLYSVSVDEGDKGGAGDGMETDDTGRLYMTNYEHNAVLRRLPDGQYETLVHDPRHAGPVLLRP